MRAFSEAYAAREEARRRKRRGGTKLGVSPWTGGAFDQSGRTGVFFNPTSTAANMHCARGTGDRPAGKGFDFFKAISRASLVTNLKKFPSRL